MLDEIPRVHSSISMQDCQNPMTAVNKRYQSRVINVLSPLRVSVMMKQALTKLGANISILGVTKLVKKDF